MNKNKQIIVLLPLIFGMGLTSCGEPTVSISVDTSSYTVTWKNYDDSILEIDENVEEGTTPSYDGVTPSKASDEQYSYTFNGWTPSISPVSSDITYVATFSSTTNKYKVTWKNCDGTILETDSDVPYGSIPTYDSETPTRVGNEDESYRFTGWSPAIGEVKSDTTYTATFVKVPVGAVVPGIDPYLWEDNKTIEYGFYPQTHVSDEDLITTLNSLSLNNEDTKYFYDGIYYVKETANVYNNETYTFDDGSTIVNGSTYWFRCETIKWSILKANEDKCFIVSKYLLDAHDFYSDYVTRTMNNETIYANNYEQSNIRKWLNNEFYNEAFSLNNTNIINTNVINDGTTSDNKDSAYACNNTNDLVYLPSYQDYLNVDYGFENVFDKSTTRVAKTTDYARARGAWYFKDKTSNYAGSYWTRSATSEYDYCVWNVNSGGYLSKYAVDGNNHSVRPSITIALA